MRAWWAMALVACSTATYVVQQYPGPPRPVWSVAILRVNGSDTVRVLSLDGDEVGAPTASDARLHFEVLPARHTLTARSADGPAAHLAFDAEAGKVYRVTSGAPGGVTAAELRVYEVERSADTPVRDVTVTTRARSEERAP